MDNIRNHHESSISVSVESPTRKASMFTPSPPTNSWPEVGVILSDLFALALGLGHLIFVCVVASLDGKVIDGRYESFQTALTTLGPLFPMVFAFMTSRVLYHIARQRLERGSTLGTLEQLMGSRTIGSTIETHFELRIFNVVAVLLLAVWSFSPLGGQSILRVLHKHSEPISTYPRYYDTIESKQLPMMDLFARSSYFAAQYTHSEVRLGPEDLWGNVKIPFLSPNEGNTTADGEGWRALAPDSALKYSAFVGVPILNVSVGNSSFAIESTYIDLTCDPFVQQVSYSPAAEAFASVETPLNSTIFTSTATSPRLPLANGTWYGNQQNTSRGYGFWNLGVDRVVDSYWRNYSAVAGLPSLYISKTLGRFANETSLETGPTNILFQARMNRTVGSGSKLNATSIHTKCRARQKYIESRIKCSKPLPSSRPSCMAISQRPSLKYQLPEDLSALSIPPIFSEVSRLPTLLIQDFDLILPYLYNQSIDPTTAQKLSTPDFFTHTSEASFSKSLSQIINSFVLLSQVGSALYEDLTTQAWDIPNAVSDAVLRPIKSAPSQTTDVLYVYSINWAWMTVCIVACVVLSASGIVGVCLVHTRRGPEVLGLVSSAIRDSRFVDVPTDVRHLDGYNFSRLMKKERFRYGHTVHSTLDAPVMGISRETDTLEL